MSESIKIEVESANKLENFIKVAFASNDMQKINSHFGGAKEFCVYRVSKDGFELEGIVKTDTSDLEGDDKTDFKIKALDGVNIMYCESIGPTAAAKVIRSGMHPMKAEQESMIEDILKELASMINTNPPPWIKKIIHVQNTQDVRLARWVN